jgi:hypothetical protein
MEHAKHCPTIEIILLLALFLQPTAGHAEDGSDPNLNDTMPRCGPPMEGQVYCKFGTLYECQFFDPNSMERRTGWRWKADLLRACAEPDPAPTYDVPYWVSPEADDCDSERSSHFEAHGGRGGAGAPTGARGRQQEGTMHIHPDGCRSFNR